MTGELIWRTSPWDHRMHGFRVLGDVVSEAICSHSAITGRLTEPVETDRRCLGCLLLHGVELAEQVGDADRYAR